MQTSITNFFNITVGSQARTCFSRVLPTRLCVMSPRKRRSPLPVPHRCNISLAAYLSRAGLHNDLRGTMDELHRVLNSIHTAVRNSTPAASPPRFLQSPPSPSAASRMEQPFAVVQNVEPKSPAYDGGLMVGDKVVKFGDAQGPAGLTVLQSRLTV